MPAYRYARHEPGVDVVLFGTGDLGHLETNLASLLAPPLPEPDRARIAALFGSLVGIGLGPPRPHLTSCAPSRPPAELAVEEKAGSPQRHREP